MFPTSGETIRPYYALLKCLCNRHLLITGERRDAAHVGDCITSSSPWWYKVTWNIRTVRSERGWTVHLLCAIFTHQTMVFSCNREQM
ncbi:hypothetical protein Y1Q_0019316 [Alligator mississippiensis]|uniref:Uncharacterized protein n=1 Tax=Alligator mississippiensis TaxID=8496 RepID=A0A151MQS1_ALLMI|nr:hypothetical protein Y1Q_0019316 [Alligator mississippiensis]